LARNPRIRISRKDKQEHKRLVRNAKSKIRRVREKYGVDLSTDITLPKLDEFKTRKEYNLWKESIQSFTSRSNLDYQFVKNKYGVVMTKREKGEIERATKQAQRVAKKLQEQYKDLPFISGGKEQGTVGERMRMVDKPSKITGIHIPPDFDFDTIQSRQMLEKKKESLKKRAKPETFDVRNERMKDNFIGMLERAFNSEADALADAIRDIDAGDFYAMYLMYDEFDFNEYYQDAEGTISIDNKDINTMMGYIEDYKSGKLNIPFKGRLS